MTSRLDMDWVRAHAERRLSPPERAVFEARMRAEPGLAELVERYGEVAAWPAEPVAASAVTFEDLRLDGESISAETRRWQPRHVAIAAGILLAFVGGFLALHRSAPPAPPGPVVLAAIREPAGVSDAVPVADSKPTLAETYVPVEGGKLRFVEGLDEARELARVAGRPAVVFVHLDGCPACAEIEKTTFRDARVLKVAPEFVFAKVSAAVAGSSLVIPSDLGLEKLRTWPLFSLLDASGAQIDAFGGMVNAEKFAARLERAVASSAAKPAEWSAVHAAARLARLGAEAVVALRAIVTLAASSGVDAALAELDRTIPRFVGSPFEADFRRIRERAASDRKFPALEYAR